jgi:hypothetical protein
MILEKALKRKKKPGKRKKRDDDTISDEELAHGLEGWLQVCFDIQRLHSQADGYHSVKHVLCPLTGSVQLLCIRRTADVFSSRGA